MRSGNCPAMPVFAPHYLHHPNTSAWLWCGWQVQSCCSTQPGMIRLLCFCTSHLLGLLPPPSGLLPAFNTYCAVLSFTKIWIPPHTQEEHPFSPYQCLPPSWVLSAEDALEVIRCHPSAPSHIFLLSLQLPSPGRSSRIADRKWSRNPELLHI